MTNDQTTTSEKIYSVAEASEILGFGVNWIRKVIRKHGDIGKKFASSTRRGTWMLTESDIAKLKIILLHEEEGVDLHEKFIKQQEEENNLF